MRITYIHTPVVLVRGRVERIAEGEESQVGGTAERTEGGRAVNRNGIKIIRIRIIN